MSATTYNVNEIRSDFPILASTVRGNPLVYLDNAATTQKPRHVISAITEYYACQNANIHRGVHYLSEQATGLYEAVRRKIGRFINTSVSCETIFTRGATESINLVAHGYGRRFIKAGDEVLVTHLEHHSNIVPWQMLCRDTGAVLRVVPVLDTGDLDEDAFNRLLNEKTKLVAVSQVSNVLGSILPVKEMCQKSRDQGAVCLVDGAQSISHLPLDVREMGADFFVFSGHKMYGPTGVGVLYGRAELLERMQPYQGGGDMILSVDFNNTVFADVPYKFEAGTPNIEGVIGLGAAIEYLETLGMSAISRHESDLLNYAEQRLAGVDGLSILGTPRERAGVLSFSLAGVHPHDIGQLLDHDGIAIRAGHHCAQPLMRRFGIPATARVSFGLYNTREEVDKLAESLGRIREVFHS